MAHDDSDSNGRSRRTFLHLTGLAGATSVMSGGAFAQQEQINTSYLLGGRVSGWQGREPEAIAQQTNPTLTLRAGGQYEITWVNVDGLPHNVAILDGQGNVLEQTEVISEQGARQTLTFEATQEMATYVCEVHPNSMRGNIDVPGGGGGTGTSEGTPSENQQQGPVYFDAGPTVGLEEVANGELTAPTSMTSVTVDGTERKFVTDQTGQVFEFGGDGLAEFFSVRDRMVTLGEFEGTYAGQDQQYDERGLLGIEFHPEFPNDRRMFLHYSVPRTDDMPEDWDHRERLSEFTVTSDLSGVEEDSETVLMDIPHPQFNHDAGPIGFGPDGYLYFPMGDGGAANDSFYGHVEDWYPENQGGNGQDIFDNLMGSIMRIDVNDGGGSGGSGGSGDEPYAIPQDNPLVGREGRDELYAWGLRNPFGLDWDSDGRLFVADVGQNLFEEANIVEKGDNLGWNVKEATHCFSTESPTEPPAQCPSGPTSDRYPNDSFTAPILEYPHSYQGETVGVSIIGGHFYEGDAVPELQGHYVYGEYNGEPAGQSPGGRLLAASPGQEGDLWSQVNLKAESADDYTIDGYVRQFGQDESGEIYVLANEDGIPIEGHEPVDTGKVYKIVPASGSGGSGGGTGTASGTTNGTANGTATGNGTTDGTGGSGGS